MSADTLETLSSYSSQMAPTVEKHEKKKSSIRRLLSPVIFSSIGNSSSNSNDHNRGELYYRRRKTEQATTTSPSSSSLSSSSPLKYVNKIRGTPPASSFRGNANRAGSSVETAFVGTTPTACPREIANVEKNCQRTSYGIPRCIIQRRRSLSIGNSCNDDEFTKCNASAPLYCNFNRVAADVQDGKSDNNCNASYRHTNTSTRDLENGNATATNIKHTEGGRSDHNHHVSYTAVSNRADEDQCHKYSHTGSHIEPKSHHRDGRSSAPPYSQYYNRSLSATSPTPPSSPTESTFPNSNSGTKYVAMQQWTAVVNECSDSFTTRCTTILRPQPLYSTAPSATNTSPGATISAVSSHLQNASSAAAGYGYVTRVPKSTSALPVSVTSSSLAQMSQTQLPPFVPNVTHRRTAGECDLPYLTVRKECSNGVSHGSNLSATTEYESIVASQASSTGAVSSAVAVIASPPIFKRGTLQSPPSLPPTKPQIVGSTATNISPKKVTFPVSTSSTAVYWPTRRGMTMDPPCRQSRSDDLAAGATADVEAAYAAIYVNASASPSPAGMNSGNSGNSTFTCGPPSNGKATINHQDVDRPFSSLGVATTTAIPRSPQNDYDSVSVAHSTPYPSHRIVTARNCDSTIKQRQIEGETRYRLEEQQRCYQSEYLEHKSQPALYDRRLQQQQHLRSKQLALEGRECDYRSPQPPSESESGSEAGEIRKILQINGRKTGARIDKELRKNRSKDPEELHRHTLSSNDPNHSIERLAVSTKSQNKIHINHYLDPSSHCYPPFLNSTLFDDDPGILSEAETSSTGFRRGNKQRSSLPVIRTLSKTMERPLGLVFLQFRKETKRSLLPNEITSLATVKALFVRSFPKQLTMQYLDSPQVKIYIHDSNKDMFYELEDSRSHLNEIRNHSVLRLFELVEDRDGALPMGPSNPMQRWNDPDQSYFSEPEFDSDFQHQHIHKSKVTKSNWAHESYYVTPVPPGSSATLPRNSSIVRSFSPAVPVDAPIISKPAHIGFTSASEKARSSIHDHSPYNPTFLDDPYYSQYSSRASSITPVIDEETSDIDLLKDAYGMYSRVKLPAVTETATNPRAIFTLASSTPVTVQTLDTTRLRVEHMERQLANLTGIVQKALTQTLPTSPPVDRDSGLSSIDKISFIEKSTSFEKSDSSYDDLPEKNSCAQHSPQAIDCEKQKPVLPSKPQSLSAIGNTYDRHTFYRDLQLTPEMYNHLRSLQKKTKDLRHELRNLRCMSQTQAHTIKESVRDTFVKIRSMVLSGGESLWSGGADSERIRITHEEEIYKEDINRLENDLTELEKTVEELRGNVINHKTKVNMTDVENMALLLSKSSKTVADLRLKFPHLQDAMKSVMSLEMRRVITEENFLKEEPKRLENVLRRCKKLTGTLVTLKRLASVQEQRLPDNCVSPIFYGAPIMITSKKNEGEEKITICSSAIMAAGSKENYDSSGDISAKYKTCKTNTFTPTQEELQVTVKEDNSCSGNNNSDRIANRNNSTTSTVYHLPSLPLNLDAKPQIPERPVDLIARRVPPPPPLRISSKSPLSSPTTPIAPTSYHYPIFKGSSGLTNYQIRNNSLRSLLVTEKNKRQQTSPSTSSSCESINSQESSQSQQPQMTPHLQNLQLEMRHQELLVKQRILQEQYSCLQQLQQTSPPDILQMQNVNNENNSFTKMAITVASSTSGCASVVDSYVNLPHETSNIDTKIKVYETDIL